VHTRVASQLYGTKLELRELKTSFTLLGACTTCLLFRSDLEDSVGLFLLGARSGGYNTRRDMM
jgi:hypothetical protein